MGREQKAREGKETLADKPNTHSTLRLRALGNDYLIFSQHRFLLSPRTETRPRSETLALQVN